MRKQFGKTLVELAEKDNRIMLIIGDFGYGIVDDFKSRFPDRFFNFGVCEQSMVAAASGLALEGMKPYVYTITPFITERAAEQIKLLVMQRANVKLVGYADYPGQGPTHAEINPRRWIEDLNIFAKEYPSDSNYPVFSSYFPKNSKETEQALLDSYNHKKPTFISLKKNPS